jgi:nucleoid-associated protein YgaU
MAAAKTLIDGVRADDQYTYAAHYNTATDAYADGVKAQTAQNWDTVNADVKKINDALDQMDAAIAEAANAANTADSAEKQEANTAVASAKERLDWAQGVNAQTNFPENYAQADEAYTNAENALAEENWSGALESANAVMDALASVGERAPLPSQYTVRTWANERDCLWNIAGYSWVYNDSLQWQRLYEANRDKLPNANNADQIEIGTVLDIPSIGDELRQGMWDESKEYETFSLPAVPTAPAAETETEPSP